MTALRQLKFGSLTVRLTHKPQEQAIGYCPRPWTLSEILIKMDLKSVYRLWLKQKTENSLKLIREDNINYMMESSNGSLVWSKELNLRNGWDGLGIELILLFLNCLQFLKCSIKCHVMIYEFEQKNTGSTPTLPRQNLIGGKANEVELYFSIIVSLNLYYFTIQSLDL